MSTEQAPKVGDFMTGIACTADEGLSLADAQERMHINNIRHLAIVRDDLLTGIVSNRDITLAQSLPNVDANEVSVATAMTADPYTCTSDSPLVDVAKAMEAHRYGAVIVVDGENRAVGMFTTTDALRALRQVVTGEKAEPVTQPTHVTKQPKERPRVVLGAHVGDRVGRAGVGPNPNQGTIR